MNKTGAYSNGVTEERVAGDRHYLGHKYTNKGKIVTGAVTKIKHINEKERKRWEGVGRLL